MIKNLTVGLLEAGKIKIGIKGVTVTSSQGKEFRPPQKLDHFIITTTERDQAGDFILDTDLMDALKQNPIHVNKNGDLVRIPVRLLYDDIELNFPTQYKCYASGQLNCYGDGEKSWKRLNDFAKETPCPCQRLDADYKGKDRCKATGTLTALIDEPTAGFFGTAHKFRTTSINTVKGMLGGLSMLSTATKGHLAGIPLYLYMTPKTTVTPEGHNVTVYIVSLCYRGSMMDLRDEAMKLLTADKQYLLDIKSLEDDARSAANVGISPGSDDERDFVEEFFPDAVVVKPDLSGNQEPEQVHVDEIDNETMDAAIEQAEVQPSEEAAQTEKQAEQEIIEADQDGPETTVACPSGQYSELYIRMLKEQDYDAACKLALRLRRPDLLYFLQTEYPTWEYDKASKKPELLVVVGDVLKARLGIVDEQGQKETTAVNTPIEQTQEQDDQDDHPFITELKAMPTHIMVANTMTEYFKPIPIDRTKDVQTLLETAKKYLAKEAPTWCAVCGKPQYRISSGTICENGHGGADSLFADPGQTERAYVNSQDGEDKPVAHEELKPEVEQKATPEAKPAGEYPRAWDESGPIQRPQLMELVRLKKILEDGGVLRPDKWFDHVAYFLDKAGNPIPKATELTTKQGDTFISMLNFQIKKHDLVPF